MELPIEAFCLNGSNQDKISLTIDEMFGFPNSTDYEGGYSFKGTLEICAGNYHVVSYSYISATGALYHFASELEKCYNLLDGKANYELLLENDLIFAVTMVHGGKGIILGEYQEKSHISNILNFEIETDQSCFSSVIQSINVIKKEFGGVEGVKL